MDEVDHKKSIQKINRQAYSLKSKYNIDTETYDMFAEMQEHTCAICEEYESRVTATGEETPLCVDHDHAAEAEKGIMIVRGLLCSRCNTGLGMFRDRPDLLRAAADYLNPIKD